MNRFGKCTPGPRYFRRACRCALVFIFSSPDQRRQQNGRGDLSRRSRRFVSRREKKKNYLPATTSIAVHRPGAALRRRRDYFYPLNERINYVTDTFAESRRAERNTDLSRGPWWFIRRFGIVTGPVSKYVHLHVTDIVHRRQRERSVIKKRDLENNSTRPSDFSDCSPTSSVQMRYRQMTFLNWQHAW